jgi:hypothetical protein
VHQFTQVEQVNKDVVKDVTPVHESGVCEEAVAQKAWENDLGPLLKQ